MKNILLILVTAICLTAADGPRYWYFNSLKESDSKEVVATVKEAKPLEFEPEIKWAKPAFDQRVVATVSPVNLDGGSAEFSMFNAPELYMQIGAYDEGISIKFNRETSAPSETVLTTGLVPLITKTAEGKYQITFSAKPDPLPKGMWRAPNL